VHLLFFHDSQDDEADSDSFPFPFEVPFLPAILDVMCFSLAYARGLRRDWQKGTLKSE
jgi:hypothetical protein